MKKLILIPIAIIISLSVGLYIVKPNPPFQGAGTEITSKLLPKTIEKNGRTADLTIIQEGKECIVSYIENEKINIKTEKGNVSKEIHSGIQEIAENCEDAEEEILIYLKEQKII